MSHVKGPWVAPEVLTNIVMTRDDWEASQYFVGHMAKSMQIAVTGVSDASMTEHARVIAAAPELLEASEQTLNWLETFLGSSAMQEILGNSGGNRPVESIKKLRQAIAKAKGIIPLILIAFMMTACGENPTKPQTNAEREATFCKNIQAYALLNNDSGTLGKNVHMFGSPIIYRDQTFELSKACQTEILDKYYSGEYK